MEKEKCIFSVDAGKGFTKYAYVNSDGDFAHSSFLTKHTLLNGLNSRILGKDSHEVEYDGKRHILGVQGDIDLRDIRTKKHEIHRLSTLTAITKMLGDKTNGAIVDVVVSMPSASYSNEEETALFEKYYKGEEDINIKVDGVDYSFTINKVTALPEAVGFTFRYPELCVGNVVLVDIGHLNINIITLKDDNIIEMVSLDKGGKELEASIVQELESFLDTEIRDNVIIDTIVRGYYSEYGVPIEETKELIKKKKEEYIESMIKLSDQKNIDFSIFDKIYFMGGTSQLLESAIKDHNKLQNVSEVMPDSRWITVEGGLIYGITEQMSNNSNDGDLDEE